LLLYIQRKEVDVENPDFTVNVVPEPVKVRGKYDAGKEITVVEVQGLGLDLTINLPGDHTGDFAMKRVEEAVLRLSNKGRLHLISHSSYISYSAITLDFSFRFSAGRDADFSFLLILNF